MEQGSPVITADLVNGQQVTERSKVRVPMRSRATVGRLSKVGVPEPAINGKKVRCNSSDAQAHVEADWLWGIRHAGPITLVTQE